MTKCRKRPFMCCALDTTEDKEAIITTKDGEKFMQLILAIDKEAARQKFTIDNAEMLSPVSEHVEICVTPFCRE